MGHVALCGSCVVWCVMCGVCGVVCGVLCCEVHCGACYVALCWVVQQCNVVGWFTLRCVMLGRMMA